MTSWPWGTVQAEVRVMRDDGTAMTVSSSSSRFWQDDPLFGGKVFYCNGGELQVKKVEMGKELKPGGAVTINLSRAFLSWERGLIPGRRHLRKKISPNLVDIGRI